MRGSFPTEEAAMKLLYLALQNASNGPCRFQTGARHWTASPYCGRSGCRLLSAAWRPPDATPDATKDLAGKMARFVNRFEPFIRSECSSARACNFWLAATKRRRPPPRAPGILPATRIHFGGSLNAPPNSVAWLTPRRKSIRRNSPFACSDLCTSRGAKLFPAKLDCPFGWRHRPVAASRNILNKTTHFPEFELLISGIGESLWMVLRAPRYPEFAPHSPFLQRVPTGG